MFAKTHNVSSNGLSKGVMASLAMSLLIAMVIIFVVTLSYLFQIRFSDVSMVFFWIAVIYTIVSLFITFLLSLLIGIPVIYVLVKLGIDEAIVAAFSGFMIIAFCAHYFIGMQGYSVLFFSAYGGFCSWAFMNGYHQGVRHE